jgi:hypothetical protein
MEKFSLKKLNEVEGKDKLLVALRLWKIWMQRWKLIVFVK